MLWKLMIFCKYILLAENKWIPLKQHEVDFCRSHYPYDNILRKPKNTKYIKYITKSYWYFSLWHLYNGLVIVINTNHKNLRQLIMSNKILHIHVWIEYNKRFLLIYMKEFYLTIEWITVVWFVINEIVY